MIEKAVTFGQGQILVGILTEPEGSSHESQSQPICILLNAGVLHRVGPNRLYVKIARRLAQSGLRTLRFDNSGLGDSPPASEGPDVLSRRALETQMAMDYLTGRFGLSQFVLGGVCSGADIALQVCTVDPRVVGVFGVNGYYLGDHKNEHTTKKLNQCVQMRYYRRQVTDAHAWIRILKRKSNLTAIARSLPRWMHSVFDHKEKKLNEAMGPKNWVLLEKRAASILLIFSEGSPALDAYHLYIRKLSNKLSNDGKLQAKIFRDTDHVFTLMDSQRELIDTIDNWMPNHQSSRMLANLSNRLTHPNDRELSVAT